MTARGPLPGWMRPIAWVASHCYATGLRRREARLAGVEAWRAPLPVISVGNVTAGGTGKSPMVRWICAQLRAAGRRPAVVMRGHRGGESSDEVLEHRAEMPDTPVAVGADRRAAIERLVATDSSVDALVLDDGFQHRFVARDLDLVLVDAQGPSLQGAALLPLGWLREPIEALRRADAVVLTRAERPDAGTDAVVRATCGRPAAARTRHAWSGLRVSDPVEGEQRWSLERLRGRAIAIWAGIGNPEALAEQSRACGARVVDAPALGDHHAFTAQGVARLEARARRAGATDVLCTGKDWVKLRLLPRPTSMSILRPELELAFLEGEEALRALIFEAIARGDRRAGR